MFKIGQKVVCIKNGAWKVVSGIDRMCVDPIKGQIYTIACKSPFDSYLSFKEITANVYYNPDRFRPLKPELSETTFDEIVELISNEKDYDTSKTN